MCWTRLAGNAGSKKVAKNRHLGTIAQRCRAISLQLRHVSTIGKKLVKHQYVLQMFPQYGELRPTSGWDRFTSLRHPCKFQRVSSLGSVIARHLVVGVSQTAALNRGRHLCSAGRPSRWVLAHILVCVSEHHTDEQKFLKNVIYCTTYAACNAKQRKETVLDQINKRSKNLCLIDESNKLAGTSNWSHPAVEVL